MTRAYLDHASSAPLRPVALEAMLPYLRDHPADPGRLHAEGRVTRVALEDAREQVAALVGARPREVVFTSSGTESVNAAIWGGLARAGGGGHVVTTAVEHSCVRDAIERAGVECTVVPVDALGRYDAAAVIDAIRARHRARQCAARQPRGRDAATRRRGVCGGTRARRAGPRGCVRGDRSRPVLVRRARRRPLFGDGAQVGRTERRGRDARAPGPARATVARRRRAGAGPAGRDRGRSRVGGLRRRRGRRRRRRRGRAPARAHRHARRRSSTRSPTSYGSAIRPSAVRSRTSCASVWRVSRRNRSCWRWISTESPCTPGRRARRRCWNRRPCSRRWASTAIIRCGCRSAGRRPRTRSTASSPCCRESWNG